MTARISKEASQCHVRIYSKDKLLVAMDADTDGHDLARTIFDLLSGANSDDE